LPSTDTKKIGLNKVVNADQVAERFCRNGDFATLWPRILR